VYTEFDRYEQYMRLKTSDQGQTQLSSYVAVGSSTDVEYCLGHSRKRAIPDAIINDLIIKCSLPLSIVENDSFRHFMAVVDSRYSPICRSTVSSALSSMAANLQDKMRQQLSSTSTGSLSVTVDIWSDRKMRGLLGVTTHTMEVSDASVAAKSYLLCCNRFKGSHTGDRIAETFDALCDEYSIKHRLDYIICDGAANMKRAFSVCFPCSFDYGDEVDVESASGQIDDDSVWENLEPSAEMELAAVFSRHSRKKMLTCYAHCLQLVVADGL
jgi:hypothetical protein